MPNKLSVHIGGPRLPIVADRRRLVAVTIALVAVVALSIVLALAAGTTSLAPLEVVRALVGQGDPTAVAIVRDVRVPTVFLAVLVGAALGSGGAAMQGLLRNPLADPYLLGVSAGAALGTSVAVALDLERSVGPGILMLAAFAGAVLTSALLATVASLMPGGLGGTRANSTLLLVGVVFNALASALVLIIQALAAPMKSQQLFGWLLGAIVPARAVVFDPTWAAFAALAALGWLWHRAHALNVLTLGDAEAASLGVSPSRVRLEVLACTSVLVSCAVAYSGLVGFVGLIVPHLVRLAAGPDHRVTLPFSALLGAAAVVVADLVARSLFSLADTMVPVGAITASVGAPFFIVLLVMHLRRAEGGA
jgi:iron complex transport system permease protein